MRLHPDCPVPCLSFNLCVASSGPYPVLENQYSFWPLPNQPTFQAHPSFYESVPGGLAEVRQRVEALQRKFNEESKVGT